MKNVLIVDDEKKFLLSLEAGLGVYKKQFHVLLAENGKKAVQVLESTPVNLVVTDLKMPEMDGFELLAHMATNFPSIPAIVMTAFGTPEIEERLKTMGALRLMEKPVEFDDLAEAIKKSLEVVSRGGSLTGVSVVSFLQLIEMEQKTCLLRIQSENRGKKGVFYFSKGTLFDAVCGDRKGEEAALEMVAWDNVEISLKDIAKKKVGRRIKTELMGLIMEGMRLKDESAVDPDDITGSGMKGLVLEEDTGLDEKGDSVPEAGAGPETGAPEKPEVIDMKKLPKKSLTAEKGGEEEHKEVLGKGVLAATRSGEKPLKKPAETETQTINLKGVGKMALDDILKPLQDVDGYLASALFDMSGEVLVQHNNSKYKVDVIGANAVALVGSALKAVSSAGLGKVNFIQVNSDKGIFGATWAVEDKSIAAILLEPNANVGLAKMNLAKVGEMGASQLA